MSLVMVAGGINVDLVVRVPRIPRPGETVHHGKLARYPGGKGANQAVAAARAGASVSMLGAVGADDGGTLLLDTLRAAVVDVAQVQRVETAATGTALILVDDSGANAIAVAEGANLRCDAQAVRAAVRSVKPTVLLTQREIADDVTRAALETCPLGCLRVMNASPLDAGADLPLDVLDILVVNEIETEILSAREVTATTARELARDLARGVGRGCVITLGSDGLVAHMDGTDYALRAHSVSAIDTTGAGDAFCGALAAALADRRPVAEALAWGNAAGALAVTQPGALPSMPSRAEIVRLTEQTLA
jgi:ribokinase